MHYRNALSPPQFPAPWASDWGEDRYGLWMALTYKQVRQVFRWVIPGTFMMGSPKEYKDRYDDEDRHQVTLTQGFWLADTLTTQALWQAVMGENPSHFNGEKSEDLPVEQVSWDDIQTFISRFNEHHPDLLLHLPTEAQWEYACRAGTTTAFNVGDDIDLSQANYRGVWMVKDAESYSSMDKEWGKEALKKTTPVKHYQPNPWGLYDCHGNVWEWCQDYFHKHLGEVAATDPFKATEGELGKNEQGEEIGQRVVRGGSWILFGRDCRSAFRGRDAPDWRGFNLGFRLAFGQPSSGQV